MHCVYRMHMQKTSRKQNNVVMQKVLKKQPKKWKLLN